jgi:deoxyribose-phosphate aldolase
MKVATFAKLFDHSIVRPNATADEVRQFAATAVATRTATLTVQPHYVGLARALLEGSDVLLGTTVGFPHGNETPAMKAYEAQAVLDLGAQEIDMVMNIPALKNCEEAVFRDDITRVVKAADGLVVKVITENVYLTTDEKRRASRWIAESGARFVKTSTAYAEGGATLDDVRLMHESVAGVGACQVKAAGGIRTLDEILEYLRAGARRFGSTRSDQFLRAFRELPADRRAAFAPFVADLTT